MIPNVTDFLAQRRLAIVGVSHEPKHFSRLVFRAFQDRGYDAVPVNRDLRVQDIRPPLDTALLLTPPAVTAEVVRDCAAAGIRRVWMYRRSPEAESFCAS